MIKTWHGARMQMMRRWHATGNFCAEQCVNCTEWSWWTPAPFAGGGTGGKTEKVETEEDSNTAGNGMKLLPVVGNGSGASADGCGDSCAGHQD